MKKIFHSPEIYIVSICNEDVLTASSLSVQDDGCKVKDVYSFWEKFSL